MSFRTGIIGQSQDIVRADVVKLGKSNQIVDWQVAFSRFIVSVKGLGAVKIIGDFLLSQVEIFSEVTNTREFSTYFVHNKKKYIEGKWAGLIFMTISHIIALLFFL